jgi:hypothetical protein
MAQYLIIHRDNFILKSVSEHGYFVASWWRTPLRHPSKILLPNTFYFQQTAGIHAPVGKRKGGSLSSRSPAPIADISNVAKIARKHSVLNLREINRNNTHNALASVLPYYGSSSSINLSCDRFIASSKVLERDCPGKVIMWCVHVNIRTFNLYTFTLLWWVLSSGMKWRLNQWKFTDLSEGCTASIFRIEE